jgi:hypothetical protein
MKYISPTTTPRVSNPNAANIAYLSLFVFRVDAGDERAVELPRAGGGLPATPAR